MRRSAASLAVLLVVLAMPLGGARVVAEGRSPVESGQPLNPQMYCMVVFEEWGTQDCRLRGEVRNVEIVRVRVVGGARVQVSVVDEMGDNPERLPEQRAYFECSQSCLHVIQGGPYTDDPWKVVVRSTAPGSAYVGVTLETAARVEGVAQA